MTLPARLFNASSYLTEFCQLTNEQRQDVIFELRSRGFSEHDIGQLFYDTPTTTDLDLEVMYLQFAEFRIHKFLRLYVPPVLLILGTLGNAFSFFILRNKSTHRQSIYVYLSILAVFDCLVLYVGLLRQWIGEVTGSDLRNENNWLCKGIIVAGYTFSDVSVWLIVAVTVERFIVVSYPLQAPHFCQEARSKKIVLGIIFVFLLINFHLFFVVDVQVYSSGDDGVLEYKCGPNPGFEYLVSHVWPWVDAMVYGFGPFLLISVLNCVILTKVCRANKLRHSLLNSRRAVQRDTNASGADYGNTRMTAMLLTISFTFLLTTLPMNISNIVADIWVNAPSSSTGTRSKGILFGTLASLLMYLNHSVNFLLYCATGCKFREMAARMFWFSLRPWKRRPLDHSNHIYCSRQNGGRCGGETGRTCTSAESRV